ncbi:hypothetical protein HispidOSU_006740B [Sigmodon hispidus]
MVNEYKKIVLLSGLESISDYNFRVVKSLLIHDLQLTKKMQDDYDRVKIADLMEEKFPRDAGLSKLIELYQDISELKDVVDTLRKRKAKGATKRPRQDESSTSNLTSDTMEDLESPEKHEDAITKSPDTPTAQSFQGEHKLPELSSTNKCSAVSEAQTPQGLPTTTSSSLQTPSEPPEISCTVLIPSQGPSAPFSTSDQTSQLSPVPASSSLQTPLKPPETSYTILTTSQSPSAPFSTSDQTSQLSPVTASSSLQTPLKPPETSYTILTTSQSPSAPFSTSDQTSQLSPVTASSSIPPQVTSVFSCSHQVPSSDSAFQASPAIVTSNVQALRMGQATLCSTNQASQMTPATRTSSDMSPQISVPSVPSRYNTPQITPVAMLCSTQASQVTPVTIVSGYNSPQVSAATVSNNYNTPQNTPATMPSSANPLPGSPATQPSNSSSYRLSLATRPGSSFVPSVSPAASLKKPRLKNLPKQPSEEDGYHSGPKQVMVLKATEPFTYDMKEDKRMFHATVATETEFFRVKVFDIVLKEKFIPKRVIVISNYFGHNGFIEIYRASSVSEGNGTKMMNIPLSLRQRATATPKINTLCTQRGGTFVNGIFAVYMKIVKDEFIYYGIEDKTGKMEVVVHGQFTHMYCEPGDKLRLFCFELSPSTHTWQLRSGRHSYLQVIRARNRGIEPPNPHPVMEIS